jgi:hypothetical protein
MEMSVFGTLVAASASASANALLGTRATRVSIGAWIRFRMTCPRNQIQFYWDSFEREES